MVKNILGPKLPLLLKEIEQFMPNTYIEIGTYQLSTFTEVKNVLDHGFFLHMYGFDLFEDAPEYELPPPDGPPLTLSEAHAIVEKWGFPVTLFKGDSKKNIPLLAKEELVEPIAVFIDGGHCYETIYSDLKNILEITKDKNTLIIIDDYVMPGPTKAIQELIDHTKYNIHNPGYSLLTIFKKVI